MKLKQLSIICQLAFLTGFCVDILTESILSFNPISGTQGRNNFVCVSISLFNVFYLLFSLYITFNLAVNNMKQLIISYVFFIIHFLCSFSSLICFKVLKDGASAIVSCFSAFNAAVLINMLYLKSRNENIKNIYDTENAQLLVKDEELKKPKKCYQKYFTCSAVTFGVFGALFAVLVFMQAAISAANRNKSNPGYRIEFTSTADHGKHSKKISFNMNCAGNANGLSTILFEVGGGSSMLDAVALQQYVSKNNRRMCIYDRAGFGWSDFPITPVYSGNRIFRDTYNMLVASGEDLSHGLTLVGHSAGGEQAQIFAQLYPDLVRGLGILDAYPDYLEFNMKPVFNWTSSQIKADQNRVRSVGRLYELVGSLSMLRWFWPKSTNFNPPELQKAHREQYINNKNWAAQMLSFGKGNDTTRILREMAEKDALEGLEIGINECKGVWSDQAACDVKWPKLKRDIPVLVIPAGTTVRKECDVTDHKCVIDKKGAEAYMNQAQLYKDTLSTKGKLIVGENMTHGFVYENFEWVGQQILEWLTE
ncbi:Alpha/beta_hydrolase fold-containing protein [Hexamita inflata]|uniref:Alpha/beta_hydrolase fold-containing protein n=1 Tax=Hexamita inflata TaxID=28002 RepID=A0ABP1HK28_9EUKA